MDENTTDTTQLEPTAPDPAEGPDPESNPAPALDLSQKVTLPDGGRVSVGDLIKMREEVEELRAYRERARSVVTNDGTFDEQYESSARYIMQDAGFSPEAIDAWFDAQRAQPEEEYMDDHAPDSQTPTSNEESLKAELAAVRRELAEIRSRAEGTDVRTLADTLEQRVASASESEVLTDLLDRLNDLGGDAEARKKFAAAEIRRITLENIKRRKAGGGRFDPRWFDEETQKAAKEVADKFRTVIGDPDMLRRAPETDAGQDMLIPRGPVKDPDLAPNADISERISEAHRFGTEKLLEGLRVGGASKA